MSSQVSKGERIERVQRFLEVRQLISLEDPNGLL